MKPQHDGKFGEKTARTVFIRYYEGNKAYDLLDLESGAFTMSHHIKFHDGVPAPNKVREPSESPSLTADMERIVQSIRQCSSPYYEENEQPPDVFFDDNNIEESSALPLGSVENKIVLGPKPKGQWGYSLSLLSRHCPSLGSHEQLRCLCLLPLQHLNLPRFLYQCLHLQCQIL